MDEEHGQPVTIDTPDSNDFFNNVPQAPYAFASTAQSAMANAGINAFDSINKQFMQIGAGDTVFAVDLINGLWIGAARSKDAPFNVNMKGEAIIKILNKDKQVVLDNIGLLNAASFPHAEKVINSDQTVTGVSWVTVGGLNHILDGVNKLPRGTTALFFAMISGLHADPAGRLDFRFLINGQVAGGMFSLNRVADPTAIQTATGMIMAQLKEGRNELEVQVRSSNANSGNIKGTVLPCVSSYTLLGK